MQKIRLKAIRVVSNHGCLEEEAKIGSDYEVNLCIWADLTTSANSDDLSDTVDYVALNRIVKEEVGVRSKLLETVVLRIVNRISQELRIVQKIEISLAKISPPIGGDVERVAVEWDWERK